MSRFAFAIAFASLFVVGCGDQAGISDAGGGLCSDGVDNDGDGLVDFPADLGCVDENDNTEDSAAMPACSDNRDNDADGKIDYPVDPGCPVPQADSEDDDCPSGPGCAQCADEIDNDQNGSMDYPGDPGCMAAGDGIEFTDNSVACGAGLPIEMLPATGLVTDMVMAGSVWPGTSPCGGGLGAAAKAYVFHVAAPVVIVASTGDSLTDFDTVLDLRGANCSDAGSEITCHDDITTANHASTITRALDPGTYYLIVSGKTTADLGTYVLSVEFLAGAGTPCAMPSDCGPGLVCRVPSGQTDMICTGPVCSDGIDDDGDGKIDYPNDPGCTTPADDNETDVCATTPTDPACPACGNGLDDDGDTLIDYPQDPSCVSASTIAESCVQSEAVIVATTPQTTGTTVGAVDDFRPPAGSVNGHLCSTTGTHSAPDRVVQLDLPATQTLAVRLSPVSYDSSHSLFPASCSGAPIDCYDNPNNMVINGLAGGRYYVVVDGYSSGSGTFTMNVSGTIANGESCELPLAVSGALACGAGYSCSGAAGSRTCRPAECNDGVDNNSDGRTDYPTDPGCVSPSDAAEDTVCPGASCPVCSDGLDNDGDAAIDYPMDTGCSAAGANNEGCRESDPLLAITAPRTTGTLVGATDDHDPSCVTTNLADRVFSLDINTQLQTLEIDTEDSVVDTVLSLMTSTCSEPSLACDDDGGVGTGDSLIVRNNVSPGQYTIAVDSDVATLDTFVLNVKGTIVPGGRCEGPLFTAGVLVCPPSFGCNGPAGSRTCTASQCQDGVDNNLDGHVDYPGDPGCTSANDNSEDTVCPGATCPACSDGTDNDNDGATDFPTDLGCTSASSTTEACADTDPIQQVLLPLHAGTLVGATDDRQPLCTTSVGADVIYTLTVPQLQSLSIDTEGSVVDTALTFSGSDCGTTIACDDDGGVGTGDSLITRTFVAAGTYTIGVDAESTTPNTYNLNVRGVISPGASCESPLLVSGVLSCSTGFACKGTPGTRTCAVAECLDGMDNNGDGRTDYPADPGCTSFSDDEETSVCPGPACPVCGDTLDNDNDGFTDYPADPSCSSASDSDEACMSSEPVRAITSLVTTGNTAGLTNDFKPTCSSSTHAAPDEMLQLDLPAMDTLTLNLLGFDTAHSLLNATCDNPAVQCSDPALMTRTNVPAGRYYVAIDGWSTGAGEWSLSTTGIITAGGSCEGALFASGAISCSTGHACAGTPGSRVCTPALCNDAMDNDADGKMDFPADPGCTSIADNDEADTCPGGAGCPLCSNGIDDDADTMQDYPVDTRCASASFFREDFCPSEVNNIAGMIVNPVTPGTLVGAADNYEQSCQTNTGNDVAYGLQLPVAVTQLVIDTTGSTAADTVVSLWNAGCTTEIGCDDDSAPTTTDNRARLELANVAAGDYAIQVDGFSTTNNNTFLLGVKGTVAAGTACTSALFSTGVLVCPSGTACTAGTCQ